MKSICKWLGYAVLVLGVIGGIGTAVAYGGNGFLAVLLFLAEVFSAVILAAILLGISDAIDGIDEITSLVQQLQRSQSETSPAIFHDNNRGLAPKRGGSPGSWKCPQCGRLNSSYVGTCGCGHAKES